MLVCTATATDVETAVRVAKAALPHDDLVGLMPFLQPAALDAETKAAAKAAEWKMADLRAAVAEATGVEEPPLEKLQRVTIGSIFMIVVLGFVAWSVISAVADIGIDTLIDEFKGANWWWVIAAILIAPFIQVGQAIATLGASMAKLRFLPVLGLQYAISFLGLAVPGSAAKIALTIRHLQLVGSNPTAAVAISVINTLGGLLVQVLVIVLTMLTGLVVLTPSSPSSGSSSSVGGALGERELDARRDRPRRAHRALGAALPRGAEGTSLRAGARRRQHRRAQGAALPHQAADDPVRQRAVERHRGDGARRLAARVRPDRDVRRADPHQHAGVAVRRPHADPRQHRRLGGRAHRRSHRGRRTAVGGAVGRDRLPHRDVLRARRCTAPSR